MTFLEELDRENERVIRLRLREIELAKLAYSTYIAHMREHNRTGDIIELPVFDLLDNEMKIAWVQVAAKLLEEIK
jgi:hypothetical protein